MLRHRNDRERMWIRISRLSGLCVKRISELFQSLKYQLDKGFKTDALIKSINKFRAADSTQGECNETGGGEVFRSRYEKVKSRKSEREQSFREEAQFAQFIGIRFAFLGADKQLFPKQLEK